MDTALFVPDPAMLLFLLLVSLAGTCQADSLKTVTIEIARERLKEGESQQIKCHTSGVEEEDVIQIYKMTINARSPVSRFKGSFTIKYVISANDTLNDNVFLQAEGRYSVTMYPTDEGRATVQLDISDVKSRDSASYMCGIGSMFSQFTDSHIETSDEKYFIVEGPIKHVRLNYPRRRTTQCASPVPYTTGQELVIQEGSKVTLDCEVGLDMNPRMPWVEVFKNSKPVECLKVETTSYYVPMHQVPLYDECVTIFYLWSFTASKKDDGAKIMCQANLPQIFPNSINTTRTLRVLDPKTTPKPVSQTKPQVDGTSAKDNALVLVPQTMLILVTFLLALFYPEQ